MSLKTTTDPRTDLPGTQIKQRHDNVQISAVFGPFANSSENTSGLDMFVFISIAR